MRLYGSLESFRGSRAKQPLLLSAPIVTHSSSDLSSLPSLLLHAHQPEGPVAKTLCTANLLLGSLDGLALVFQLGKGEQLGEGQCIAPPRLHLTWAAGPGPVPDSCRKCLGDLEWGKVARTPVTCVSTKTCQRSHNTILGDWLSTDLQVSLQLMSAPCHFLQFWKYEALEVLPILYRA